MRARHSYMGNRGGGGGCSSQQQQQQQLMLSHRRAGRLAGGCLELPSVSDL